MPGIFGNNMVIQQGINAPVWGTTIAEGKIKISFAGFTTKVQADTNGKWMAMMPVLKASGPHEMTITTDRKTVKFKNVMVGEVWLASGQSNMEFFCRE